MLAGALCYHCEFEHSNSKYNINMFVKLAVLACVAAMAFGQHWGGNGGQNSLDSGAYTGDGDYHGEGLQEAGAFGDVSQNWNANNGQQQWNGDNGQGQWNGGNQGQPQWNGGNQGQQWNAGNQGQPQWNAGNQGGQWNGGNQGGWNGGNQGGWNGGHAAAQPGLLPAGVNAAACPNYPYCH